MAGLTRVMSWGGAQLTQEGPVLAAAPSAVVPMPRAPGPGEGRARVSCRGHLAAAPQDNYNLLHKRINHTWDFVVMQAREQLR